MRCCHIGRSRRYCHAGIPRRDQGVANTDLKDIKKLSVLVVLVSRGLLVVGVYDAEPDCVIHVSPRDLCLDVPDVEVVQVNRDCSGL